MVKDLKAFYYFNNFYYINHFRIYETFPLFQLHEFLSIFQAFH